jgi:signal transduction histidine kinase
MRIKYVFLGSLIGSLGSIDFLPNYGISIYPFGFVFMIVFPLVFIYAISRYHLMDVTLLLQRYSTIYLLCALTATLIFLPLGFLFGKYFWLFLGIVFLIVLIHPYLHRKLLKIFEPFVDEVILRGKYSYWKRLKEFWERKEVIYTSEQLADILAREIPLEVGIESASFFLFDRNREVFVPISWLGLDEIFAKEEAQFLNTLYPDDPIPALLEKEKNIIIYDEMTDKELLEQAREIKAVLSAPLFVGNKLVGILNLGHKKRGELYFPQDIELIKDLTRFAQRHLAHSLFLENSIFFSGSVAHDIRSPLKEGIIYEYLEGIKEALKESDLKKGIHYLTSLENRIIKFHRMMDKMVDIYASLERFVKGEFKAKRLNYNEKVKEIVSPYIKKIEEKKLAFNLNLPKECVFIYADEIDLERILTELLTNALKYTERGKIEIKVWQDDPYEVTTCVADTGCGIPQDKLEYIFEPFARIKSENVEGVGVGLASIKQLIERNGGRIWVESKQDEGSSFYFALPSANR